MITRSMALTGVMDEDEDLSDDNEVKISVTIAEEILKGDPNTFQEEFLTKM
jgi:hypothetical protein